MRRMQNQGTQGLDWAAAILGLLVVASVYSDGWAHLNVGGLDTFFSPWHGALYGSFTALTLLLVGTTLMARRRGAVGWPMGVEPITFGSTFRCSAG